MSKLESTEASPTVKTKEIIIELNEETLHYEDYSEHLMSRFGKLLQMQSLVDMTLMCSSHTLRVHKAVLAASSAYFQEVLQKQNGEPLIILKMRFSVLKCLVEFMYCGKTQCLEENLDELVSAAQFLKIKGLSKVTKEGLGITNQTKLPLFTPPVVINRPPQSLIDLHSQDNADNKIQLPQVPSLSNNNNQSVDNLNRTNKDMVMCIPFDIENGANTCTDYSDPFRTIRPRRGRPSFKRPSGWEGGGIIGRAAERALMRREQDSRKAIHHLKHLQTRHMQDYMDRVTLSQAVNSICNNDTTSPSYLNMDNDIIYMDQSVSSNQLDSSDPFAKDSLGNEALTSNFSNATTITSNDSAPNVGINTAMSQYVNALKNAGLPTDLPILFESGDGSYINVNEQVLLDMVQSSEIQYEVIEQPNIIEKVADPSEIRSIDELSKSIERGEMLLDSKSFSTNDFDKSSSIHEDTINSLNEILPDNLEEYSLQSGPTTLDRDNNNDFSCIDSDMQFFTKSMSEDVKKYYDDQQLNDARALDQYCPASTSFDTSFSMPLLDSKTQLGDNTTQQYSSINTDDLKRNDACYDFSLQLPHDHTNGFKEDALDCLLSTPKRNENQESYINNDTDNRLQEQDEIMKDLMNIENRINMGNCDKNTNEEPNTSDNINTTLDSELANISKDTSSVGNYVDASHNLQWDFSKINDINETDDNINGISLIEQKPNTNKSVADLSNSENIEDKWDSMNDEHVIDNENKINNYQDTDSRNSTLDENIPFAVGLLPLKQVQMNEETLLKRKNNVNYVDFSDNVDAKCLKRKIKCKKI